MFVELFEGLGFLGEVRFEGESDFAEGGFAAWGVLKDFEDALGDELGVEDFEVFFGLAVGGFWFDFA